MWAASQVIRVLKSRPMAVPRGRARTKKIKTSRGE